MFLAYDLKDIDFNFRSQENFLSLKKKTKAKKADVAIYLFNDDK